MRVDDAAEDKGLVVGLDVVLEQLGDKQRQRRLIFAERQGVVARDRRVVDRQDLNLDSGRDRESGGVRDRIAEQQRAMEVCRGRDPILPILECRDRSIGRCADEAEEGDRLAFRIVVIRKKLGRIDIDIGVFERAEPMVGHCDRNVELRQDGERHSADAICAMRVGYPIGEGGVAEIALAGREDGGVADHGNGAIVAIEQFDDCEAVALDVTIVGKKRGQVDDESRVLVADEHALRIVAGAHAIGIGVGGIVDRCDLEREGPGACQTAVRDRVAEGRGPAGIFLGHEAVASTWQALNAAQVAACLKRDETDRIAVKVAVVADQVGGCEFERRILVRAEQVGHCGWCMVGRLHVDGDGAGPGAIDIVGDDIVEPGLPAEVGVGCEDDRRAVEVQRAVSGIEDSDEADRIAIDVMVVRQELRRRYDDRGFLERREAVGAGIGRFVTPFDRDAHGRAAVALAVVGDDVGEAVLA